MSKKRKNKKQVEETPVQAVEEAEALDSSVIDSEEIEVLAEETESLESSELAEFAAEEAQIFLQETEGPGFLPEVSEKEADVDLEADEILADTILEGTELEQFDSADIVEVEFVEQEKLLSIVESILFASDRPVSLASLKQTFKGTNVKTDHLRKALNQLSVDYASGVRGVTLEEVPGGYQLRTKLDNIEFLKRTLKTRAFRLSGPALEVMAIVAYKQPIVKNEVDSIRGVESGHLMRALMEKGLVNFQGKSELPGRPMFYGTTKKFLEIFSLRNLKELPSLSEIDQLLPEGIGEEEVNKPKLADLTESMSESVGQAYSEGEEELMKISEQLETISTSSDFFEQENVRQRQKKDADKAQNIREALTMGEEVSTRDRNWLTRYDLALAEGEKAPVVAEEGASEGDKMSQTVTVVENDETAEAIAAFDDEDDDLMSEDDLNLTSEDKDIDA
ncbi:MAG: SMC-Scp complex subunit ScpB [Pseudobdellovibrionaceae bacterium]